MVLILLFVVCLVCEFLSPFFGFGDLFVVVFSVVGLVVRVLLGSVFCGLFRLRCRILCLGCFPVR